MGRVEGKIALVTGAAKGLGKAIATLLSREGAKVILTDLDETEGVAAAEEIRATGAEALFLRHNVALDAEWESVVAAAVRHFGRLDILVNNAGIAFSGNIETTTLEDWRRVMSINLDGVFLGVRHGVLAMKDHGGSIVNLSSIEGLVGDPNLTAYNASKGGVRLLTKSAALHCAKAGYKIRVNSVHPGYIWTPMVQNYAADTGDSDAAHEALVALHPIGHLGEPMDIAYGVLYLASAESKFATGSELVIDGGYTAQ